MKQNFLFKLVIILFVLLFLPPVYLLAVSPNIQEQDISYQGPNRDHDYFFDICFDDLKVNSNNYIIEAVLYGKKSSFETNIPYYNNYKYNKETKQFIYKGTNSKNKCEFIHKKYKIYIHDFQHHIRKISVTGVNKNNVPQSLKFQNFDKHSKNNIILVVNDRNNFSAAIWSKTTCFDKYGFAYFSSEDYINCNDLIKLFNKAPLFDKELIIRKKIIKVDEKFSFLLPDGVFTDEDGDILRYETSTLPDWLHFNPSTNTFTGIPKKDDAGSYTITVTAGDTYNTTSGSFVLTVKDVNAPPVYVGEPIDDLSANEDKLWEWTFPADKFADEDGDTLTYSVKVNGRSLSPSSWLKFDQNKLKFSGTPSNKDVGKYTISVTATDNKKEVSVQFKLTIHNTNDAPLVKMPFPDKTYNAGDIFDFHFRDHFSDPDRNDRLTYEVRAPEEPNLPNWINTSKSGRFHGTIPGDHPSKSYMLSVKAYDGNLYSEENIFSFIVENVYSDIDIESKQNDIIDESETTSPELIEALPLKVIPAQTSQQISVKPEDPEVCFDDYKRIFFSSVDQNGNSITPQIATLISSPYGKVYKRQISCFKNTLTCSFCGPPDTKSKLCYIWKKSGEYIGELAEKKSPLLVENQTLLFVKKPKKCAYINKRDFRLNLLDKNMKAVHNVFSDYTDQPNENIGQFISIKKLNTFYKAWKKQKDPKISCQCGSSCNLIFLDDNLSYFQRVNHYWTYKTLDYSKGPLLIPIPITTPPTVDSIKIFTQKKYNTTKNEYLTVDTSSQNIFQEPCKNNYEEYKFSSFFGMVHLNRQFNIPNNFDVQSLYIASIDLNNKIVYSPVFCENSTCKYYSPPSVRFTFVWRKGHNGYRFLNSLPSKQNVQRYSLIDDISNIKEHNVIKELYNTMEENQIGNVCINQKVSEICISDFLSKNSNSINASDFNIGNLYFRYNDRGNFILFNSSNFCLKKNKDYWDFTTLLGLKKINSINFSFKNVVRKKAKSESPCFWGRDSINYYETPIYNSREKHYQIQNSTTFSIGYENFIQEQLHCIKTEFSKWIIVDEYLNEDNSLLMSPLLINFKRYELKKLIKKLTTESTCRLDGIKGNCIKRKKEMDSDYFTFRKTADFVKALPTIEPHNKPEQNLNWELHVFVPRKTSIASFNVSEENLRVIKEKLKNLNVKRFCLWEFSNSKPMEETAYKKLMDSLKNNSFNTRYQVVYEQKHINEIINIVSKK